MDRSTNLIYLIYRCRQIGLVPKKILGDFRRIHHLSYPAGKYVNDSIPDNAATVVYINVGAVIDVILQLGRGCLMSKTDIEKAFRLIPIRNDEHHLLGFSFSWFILL